LGSRFFSIYVESSNYGIFGSIPTVDRRVPKSLHSKTLKIVDSGGKRHLRNISPLIIRMGKSKQHCQAVLHLILMSGAAYREKIHGGRARDSFDMSGFVALPVQRSFMGPWK
jgi:hypothetical protein